MTDNNEQKSSGKGKFIAGAALGAIAGAVAGHFISKKMQAANDDCDCDHEGPCGEECPCDENCHCKKGSAVQDSGQTEVKKPGAKKSTKTSKED